MMRNFGMIVAFMSLIIFSGCQDTTLPYNAIIYGNVHQNREWLKDTFYESNLTYGSYSITIQDYIRDNNYPFSRTKILQTEGEYEIVFQEFPIDIDFENTTIVMYCFTTVSGSSYEIENISINEKKLSIQYSAVQSEKHPPDASMPLSKWIIVTLDKSDIETAEFIYNN